MSFFDEESRITVTHHVDVTGFANALQNRQTFVVPDPSPRMVQALARQAQGPGVGMSRLTLPTSDPQQSGLKPSSTSMAPPQQQSQPFTRLFPDDVPPLLSQPSTLILDIRPHAQYQKKRLPGAVNLAVPSTLLRRPAFSLDKLCTMLPEAKDKEAFQTWKSARTIVVYDMDSAALSDASNVQSLLNKLQAAGAPGKLAYVYGGINAVVLSAIPGLLDSSVEEDSPVTERQTGNANFLSVRQLSLSAFQQGSTTGAAQRPGPIPTHGKLDDRSIFGPSGPLTTRTAAANPFYDNIRQHRELSGGISERIPLFLPKVIRKRARELPFPWLKDIVNWSGGSWVMKRSTAGDEDQRMSDGGSITGTGSTFSGRSSSRRKAREAAEEGTEALAMQFYRIELGEQRRLQGLMDHHSRESKYVSKTSTAYGVNFSAGEFARGVIEKTEPSNSEVDKSSSDEEYFPFSITAGIEKGAKNRYRNIWPFDHARVRLHRHCSDDDSDYINASYIQPRCTQRQYIATQGPLPSTFNDFWSLVWEQNVRVVVMLTKLVEGNQAKSGMYWKDGIYGTIKVRLLKEEGGTEGERAEENRAEGADAPVGGFDFRVSADVKAKKARRAKADMDREFGKDYKAKSAKVAGEKSSSSDDQHTSSSVDEEDEDDDSIIRREFELTHTEHPEWLPRTVVQFQYVGWPDVSVPSTPKNLLKLIDEINILHEEYRDSGVVGTNEKGAAAVGTTSNSRADAHRVSRAAAVEEANGHSTRHQANSQILVHCSAGIGRTGSFVVIDAVLDAVRREMKKKAKAGMRGDEEPQSMGDSENTDSIFGLNESSVAMEDVQMSTLHKAVTSSQLPPSFFQLREPGTSVFSGRTGDSVVDIGEVKRSTSPVFPSHKSDSSKLPSLSIMNLSGSPPKVLAPAFSSPAYVKSPMIKPPGPPAGSLLQRRMQQALTGGVPDPKGMATGGWLGTESSPSATTPTLTTRPSLSLSSLKMPNTMSTMPSSPGTNYRTNSEPPSPHNEGSSFDFAAPRMIKVPKHSRKNHNKSYAKKKKLDVLHEEDSSTEEGGETQGEDGDAMEVEADGGLRRETPPSKSPSPLSTLDEPVRQVLEGIREQRMSMCQSLRQYVFIHRAIVEGTIQIVDQTMLEENKRAALDEQAKVLTPKDENDMDMFSTIPTDGFPLTTAVKPTAFARPFDLNSPWTGPGNQSPLSLSSANLLRPSSSVWNNKRLASPTELIRTDASGQTAKLSKRPSLKRINKSIDSASSLPE